MLLSAVLPTANEVRTVYVILYEARNILLFFLPKVCTFLGVS